MNRREGVNSFVLCLRWSNSIAPAMPFPVQLPSCPWSYTGGHSVRRSTEGGRPCENRIRGAPYTSVQDPRRGGREAAQSPLLPGAPRPRVFGKDGRSAVRLSQSEAVEEGRSQVEGETNRCGSHN